MTRTIQAAAVMTLICSSAKGAGILNGSFEEPYVYPSYIEGATDLGSNFVWVIESGNIDLLGDTFPVGNAGTPFGDQHVDLCGNTPGAIYQDFTFPSHGQWAIAFHMTANTYGGNPKTMVVEFGEVGNTSVVGIYTANVGDPWLNVETPAFSVSTDAIYRLRFRGISDGASGVYLDNVRLVPIGDITLSLSIRGTVVEVCWDSVTNAVYQIQYTSDLTTNQWVDLGNPIQATNSVTRVTDSALVGEEARFYRLSLTP